MSVRRLAPVAVAIAAFVLYLLTLNPTFGFIDKGELVAVASTLGIAHPTGYPTIMMLGWLATKLLPVRSVLALNILSAFLTAAGIGVLSLAFAEMLRRAREERATRRPAAAAGARTVSKRSRKKGAIDASSEPAPLEQLDTAGADDGGSDVLYASLGALFVGVTATWWNQANGFEVYSLHALLIAASLYYFLRWAHTAVHPLAGAPDPKLVKRYRVLFPLMLGLAFTNHLTVVLLAPALLVYFATLWGQRRSDASIAGALGEIVRLAPWFLVGLLPYLYLPLRAARDPLFNWGDPSSWSNFYHHVTGRQYGIWMFQFDKVFEQQTAYFFGKLPSEVAYIGLLIAALGIVYLVRRSPRLAAMAVLIFVTCSIWAGGYDILEIEPYYMLAILALGMLAAAGARFIEERFDRRAALAALGILVALTAAINFGRANERSNTVVEDMTHNVLTTLPKDAVIISSQWDFWVAGSFYMQAVEGLRPDVVVLDQELLRRSWYLEQMEHWHPELLGPLKSQIDRFRVEVLKFENDAPYDPNEIQSAYIGMIDAIIDEGVKRGRPVYVTGEVPPEMGARYRRVPNHLALRLTSDSAYVPQEFPTYRFNRWEGRVDHYAAKAYELYGRAAYARALYEAQAGKNDLAQRYFDYALSFDPKWTADDVPDQSLNSEDQTRATIEFFEGLKMAAKKGPSK